MYFDPLGVPESPFQYQTHIRNVRAPQRLYNSVAPGELNTMMEEIRIVAWPALSENVTATDSREGWSSITGWHLVKKMTDCEESIKRVSNNTQIL